MRRTLFVALLALLLCGKPSAALAGQRLGVVNVLAPLSPDPINDSAVLTTVFVGAGTAPGEPYIGAILGDPVRTSGLLAGISSAEPTDLTADPVASGPRHLVWSHCPGNDAHGSPTCTLQTSTNGSNPVAVEATPEGRQDRMPAVYRGAVAFARRSAQHGDQLRFLAAGSARSVHLHGAPSRWGMARIAGLALRARTLAYVWRTQSATGRPAETLQLQRVGDRPRTLVTIPATRGHLIGPAWDGGAVLFGIRWHNKSSSTLYRYLPRSGRYEKATGPSRLAALARGRGGLFWSTAPESSITSGICDRCTVYTGIVPTMSSATRPR